MPSLSGQSQTGVPRATLAENAAPHQEDTGSSLSTSRSTDDHSLFDSSRERLLSCVPTHEEPAPGRSLEAGFCLEPRDSLRPQDT